MPRARALPLCAKIHASLRPRLLLLQEIPKLPVQVAQNKGAQLVCIHCPLCGPRYPAQLGPDGKPRKGKKGTPGRVIAGARSACARRKEAHVLAWLGLALFPQTMLLRVPRRLQPMTNASWASSRQSRCGSTTRSLA